MTWTRKDFAWKEVLFILSTSPNLDGILRIQDYFMDAADRHGVPIVDNDSFDRAVLLIIRHVTETLRKRSGVDPADLL